MRQNFVISAFHYTTMIYFSQYLVRGESIMKDNLPRYTLRVSQVLLDKLAYIAEYEGRTKNKELEQLIKKRIAEFESEHGTIETH